MLKLEVDELTNIHKYDVVGWYDSFIKANLLKCRRLCMHVWGFNAHKDDAIESTKLGNVIDDILAISSMQFFLSSMLIAMDFIL